MATRTSLPALRESTTLLQTTPIWVMKVQRIGNTGRVPKMSLRSSHRARQEGEQGRFRCSAPLAVSLTRIVVSKIRERPSRSRFAIQFCDMFPGFSRAGLMNRVEDSEANLGRTSA